ncbi:SAM-dependent methyltransferase [Paenibacillus sp. BIHB 4019]|uniref:SAM-dependent methyltransferase n=1 Tax=Paenibacillus sp. BIHB 4019 TaxID=1870819 RepID=A0A1B2DPX4_9BACL|nr:class I SAM-dependent methyltransferase [Paenibacillus sp. BIHB 4019]ANY69750.1 SAM-dependent methyltransferase [Paenibacillus sp. BIHB 4019]
MNEKQPQQQKTMSWNDPQVEGYGRTISLKIPGYFMLYDMTDRLMNAMLGPEREQDILVVGAGGGQEIVTLGGAHPAWRFTGVDPSARMLAIAEQRIRMERLEAEVTLHEGTADELPKDKLHDAATSLLVLHFIKGLDQKRELLRSIAERLKPGAPLFIAAISCDRQEEAFAVQMSAWQSHMLDNGIPLEDWERFAASIGAESDPVPPEQVEELLREVGFNHISKFFGSYLITGWFAVKADGELNIEEKRQDK